jgi:SAM-dependent methyltransferase
MSAYSQGLARHLPCFARPPEETARLLAALQSAGVRQLVDLGAGVGGSALALGEAGLQVLAVEPDDEMAAVLAARLAHQPGLPVALLRGPDALPAEQAEAVLCQSVLHLLDAADQLALLRQAQRLLVPGASIWLELPLVSTARQALPWALMHEAQRGPTRVQLHRTMHPAEVGPGWVTVWRIETRWGEKCIETTERRFDWTPMQPPQLRQLAEAAGLCWREPSSDWAGTQAFEAALHTYGYFRLQK